MHVIEVKNISKSFGANCAVDKVSFDVQPGEIFALLGPNAADKTTTIRMILDILQYYLAFGRLRCASLAAFFLCFNPGRHGCDCLAQRGAPLPHSDSLICKCF